MSILFYNSRELGGREEITHLVGDQQKSFNIICLHATIKASQLVEVSFYIWNVKPACLIVVRNDVYDVFHEEQGTFYVSLVVEDKT